MTSSYDLITPELLEDLVQQASLVPRLRRNHNFHRDEDVVQRMLNAIEPGSYVRPHRHFDPPKTETFLVLRGKLAVLIFDEQGKPLDILRLDERVKGIDIKPGVWHSIVALEPGTVIFEVKTGPYIQATDKDFATWAPAENTAEAPVYLAKMQQYIQEKLA